MPEVILEFAYSSLEVAVENDAILPIIRALVSNHLAIADGPPAMDV